MKYINRHNIHIRKQYDGYTFIWLLSLLLCLSACSSGVSDDAEGLITGNTSNTKLYIYVYAPQEIQATRAAYDGDILPMTNESSVYSLQIWVFTHTSHQLLGYYSSTEPSSLSSSTPYELIQLTIDESYAQTEETNRERVDVYVAANVKNSNCNLTLDQQTTQSALEAALIQKTTADPFGLTAPVSAVTENEGLPMSGVVRNLPVTGTAPVLRLDNGGQIATVSLIRSVSKLRFAFSRKTGSEPLRINSIKLNTEMLPMAEYLFMAEAEPYDRHTCHIDTGKGYETGTPNLLSEAISEVATNDEPVQYAWGYDEVPPNDYEWRIENAALNNLLTQRYFYLRESDKRLEGTIKYKIGEGEEQTATFRMVDNGGFSRNHVWTVYAYQAQTKLHVVVANVTPWKVVEEDYDFYNW
jgi:hypothetical protein